jgi:hypothetical protein
MESLPGQPAPEEPISRILTELQAPDVETRLAAVQAALQPGGLTHRLLLALELLAINDPDPRVRAAAQAAQNSTIAQNIYRRGSLSYPNRMDLLLQINRWLINGTLTRDQAMVLRQRYNFDIVPSVLSDSARKIVSEQVSQWLADGLVSAEQAAALSSQPEEPKKPQPLPAKTGAAAPIPAAGPQAAAPQQSFTQVVFSELTIRIALYLGGFLIIAAALILAAILEIARLPILLTLTAAAGVGAGLLRKRLSLPSFVLFLIFTCLLPIDARIWADLAHFQRFGLYAFWWLAWMLVAEVLAVGARRYTSRWLNVFSLGASLLAQAVLILPAGSQIHPNLWVRLTIFFAAEMAVLLLAWTAVRSLRRWKDARFASPLDWAAQLTAAAASIFGLGLLIWPVIMGQRSSAGGWFSLGFAFILAAAHPILYDLGIAPRRFYRVQAAAMLFLVPFAFLNAFSAVDAGYLAGLTGWGLALMGASELARRSKHSRLPLYSAPLAVSGTALFAWCAISPAYPNPLAYFLVLLGAALALSLLHGLQRRLPAWMTALVFACLAFFNFFSLPFAAAWHVDLHYQAVSLALLLLLPDLVRGPLRNAAKRWTLPARWLGLAGFAFLIFICLVESIVKANFSTLLSPNRLMPGWVTLTVVMGAAGLASLGYALRFHLPRLVWAVAAFSALALITTLHELNQAAWSAWLTGLGFGYAGLGYLIHRQSISPAWARGLRHAGLAIAAAALGGLFFEPGLRPGLALLAGGGLFLAEMITSRSRWLEPGMDLLLCAGSARLVVVWSGSVPPLGTALLCMVMILLGFDLLFSRGLLLGPAGASEPAPAPEDTRDPQPGQNPAWPARAKTSSAAVQQSFIRAIGLGLAVLDTIFIVLDTSTAAAHGVTIFLLFFAFSLLLAVGHRQPRLLPFPASFLALGLLFGLRAANQPRWLIPLVGLAFLYYLGSVFLERRAALKTWGAILRLCGLGLAMLTALSAPLEGGLLSSLPVAAAATLYAVEAFRRRNAWLGFPANGLYLLAYFIILYELKVDQPQYFSVGVAALGLLQHYLLIRSGSRIGAFLTGMVSQLALLGTTYIQMVSTHELAYFIVLFFQGLAVLGYGVYLRSRSLVIAPLVFIVIGVIAVVLSILSGVPTALIIGCTGVTLLVGGILAVVLRERLLAAGEKMGAWRP